MDDEEKEFLEETKNNEIVEIDADPEEEALYDDDKTLETTEEIPVELEPKKKKKIKLPKWKDLNEKQRIIFIIVLVIIILGIAFGIWYFCFRKTPKAPDVIVTENNYRYENGNLIFLNKNGDDIGEYSCTNKDEKLCFVAYFTPEEKLDVEKYVDEDNNTYKLRSLIYQDNYVFVYDNSDENSNNLKLYNMQTKSVENNYTEVKAIEDDKVIAEDTDKNFGVITFKSDSLDKTTEFKYDYLGYLNNKLVYQDGKTYGIMDLDNKTIASNIKYEIKGFDDKYIIVSNSSKYYLEDYKGTLTSLTDAGFISLNNGYIAYISGGKLDIYNEGLVKLNYDTIELNSSDYVKVSTVDSDGKVKETSQAFTMELDGNLLKITYNDTKKLEINVNEANINSKFAYVSYSNGTLYFYSDTDKTKEIGSYVCNKKNDLNATTDAFVTCFVAKESKLITRGNSDSEAGYLPIYNSRFVFIKDGTDIVLYDLNKNEKKSTYTSVDAGYYNASNNITVADTANIMIMAKHSDNTLGIITLTSTEAKGIVPFKCESIKYLDNNFLAKYTDGTYHLFTSSGDEITKNITTQYEIIGYLNKYILVKHDDNYLIYNTETGQIVSDEMKYIEMTANGYVGINNDFKLNFYTYENKKQLLCNSATVLRTSNLPLSYKINYVNDSKITVSIYNIDGSALSDIYEFNGNNYTVGNKTYTCE